MQRHHFLLEQLSLCGKLRILHTQKWPALFVRACCFHIFTIKRILFLYLMLVDQFHQVIENCFIKKGTLRVTVENGFPFSKTLKWSVIVFFLMKLRLELWDYIYFKNWFFSFFDISQGPFFKKCTRQDLKSD